MAKIIVQGNKKGYMAEGRTNWVGAQMFFRKIRKFVLLTDVYTLKDGVVLLDVLDISTNTVHAGLHTAQAEPRAWDVLSIGDKVASRLGGGFEGEVTAFEKSDNRVVCKKPSETNRVRYAYEFNDIEKMPEGYEFVIGEYYSVDEKKLFCVEGAGGSAYAVLVDGVGRIKYTLRHKKVLYTELINIGIESVERIG